MKIVLQAETKRLSETNDSNNPDWRHLYWSGADQKHKCTHTCTHTSARTRLFGWITCFTTLFFLSCSSPSPLFFVIMSYLYTHITTYSLSLVLLLLASICERKNLHFHSIRHNSSQDYMLLSAPPHFLDKIFLSYHNKPNTWFTAIWTFSTKPLHKSEIGIYYASTESSVNGFIRHVL